MCKIIIYFEEFEHERLDNAKWKKAVEEKLDLILSHLKYPTAIPGEESQSMLEYGTSYLEKQKVFKIYGELVELLNSSFTFFDYF